MKPILWAPLILDHFGTTLSQASDLVCEIPSMANSPAIAPGAKCPTRIICLIFFGSFFLGCQKMRMSRSEGRGLSSF